MSLGSLAFARRRLQAVEAREQAAREAGRARQAPHRLRAWLWRTSIWAGAGVSFGLDWLASGLGPWLDALDSTAGWLLSALLSPLELLLSVPYLGRGLGLVWRGWLTLVWSALRIPEALLFLLGVAPEKRVRLWLLMPEPELSADQKARLGQAIAAAQEMLLRQANVRLVSTVAFAQTYPMAALRPEPFEHLPAPGALALHRVEAGCLMAALRDDLGWLGGALERAGLQRHLRGAYRRMTGWGSPLMAVVVGSVDGGRLAGCSLGPLADYFTIDHDQPICLAHEIGHACNLPHINRRGNLMNPTCGGVHLVWWQAMLLRMSRHVTQL